MTKKILEKDSKYQHDQQKIHSQLSPTDQGSVTLQRITKELVGLGRSLVITGMSLEMGDKAEDISNFYPNITTETVIERVLIKPKLLSESVPNYYVGDVVPAMHAKVTRFRTINLMWAPPSASCLQCDWDRWHHDERPWDTYSFQRRLLKLYEVRQVRVWQS